VDVTATFPRKIAALRAHESQTGHMEDLTERLRTRLALTAKLAGLPQGRLAEGLPGPGHRLSRVSGRGRARGAPAAPVVALPMRTDTRHNSLIEPSQRE
jgi:hypothetical protein